MEELDRQRDGPPAAIEDTGKAGAEHPQPNQHDDGIAVVQRLGLDDPREEVADKSTRFGNGPSEAVDLESLEEMLRPVGQHDCREQAQREFVLGAVQTLQPRHVNTIAGRMRYAHQGDASPAGEYRGSLTRPHSTKTLCPDA